MQNSVCFLDRDGVLVKDVGYPHKWHDDLILNENVNQLSRLLNHNINFIIVTNQSGIGRGYFTEKQYHEFTLKMITCLLDLGLPIKNIYHCPHAPEDECSCRKPKTGLIEQAFSENEIDINNTFLIGDKLTDVFTGTQYGIKNNFLLNADCNMLHLPFAYRNMFEICNKIIEKFK
jgi:D-glycero-D-manno-heptose 1,7-bisphosphate phosphatase